MARTLWDRLADVENTIRARKGQPPINALVGSPYINAARARAVAALAQSAPALAKLICDGPAKFCGWAWPSSERHWLCER